MNIFALICFKSIHFNFSKHKKHTYKHVFVAFINNLITDSSLLRIKLNKAACQFAKCNALDLNSGEDGAVILKCNLTKLQKKNCATVYIFSKKYSYLIFTWHNRDTNNHILVV